MTIKISLELTQEQALAVSQALEMFMRLGLGQFEFIEEEIRSEKILKRTANKNAVAASLNDCSQIESLMMKVKSIMGHSESESFGISNKNVSINAKRSYEVLKVIEKALADPTESNQIHQGIKGDGLKFRVTEDPEPLVQFHVS